MNFEYGRNSLFFLEGNLGRNGHPGMNNAQGVCSSRDFREGILNTPRALSILNTTIPTHFYA